MGVLRTVGRIASAFTYPLRWNDVAGIVDPLFSSKQFRGRVTDVIKQGPRSATVRFRPAPGWQGHRAGQWVRVGVEIDGVRHWRSYSLSTAPDQDPAITVTDIGAVSGALVRRVKPGDILYLDQPQGDFVLPEHPRPLLMLTGGSGITPVMSMIRTLIGARADADVVLLHTARTPAEALFTAELDQLRRTSTGLQVTHWYSSSQGRLDLTSAATLDQLCPDWRERAAYVCGPESMVADAEQLWAASGVEAQLSLERFTTRRVEVASGQGGQVTFTRSDKVVQVPGDQVLLDAGEAAGVTMPSGCRIGICRTCLTKLDAGAVRDLTTGEVHGEAGDLIRTCVSAPAGDVQLDL